MKDAVAKSAVAYLGGVLALALIAQCGPAKSPTEPQPTAQPQLTATPGPTGSNPVAGTRHGTEVRTEDTCLIFPPSFSVTVVSALNGSTLTNTLIETATFISKGILQSGNSFTTTGTFSFGGFAGTQTLTGRFTGNMLIATDTREFNTGCPGKRFVGQITAT